MLKYREAFRLDADVERRMQEDVVQAAPLQKPADKVSESQEEPEFVDLSELFRHQLDLNADKVRRHGIMTLPSEIISRNILCHLAAIDFVSVERFSRVCKLFYLYSRENQIWWQAIISHWQRKTTFPIPRPQLPQSSETVLTLRKQFLEMPRIRCDGVYISHCRYWREGGRVSFSATSSVNVVSYYRYLRFYPDGTVIGLLTSLVPEKIVYRFRKPGSGPTASDLQDVIAEVNAEVPLENPHDMASIAKLSRLTVGKYNLLSEETEVKPMKHIVSVTSSVHEFPKPASQYIRRAGKSAQAPAIKYVYYTKMWLESIKLGSWNKLKWHEYYSVNPLAEREEDRRTDFDTDKFRSYIFSRVQQLVREE